VAKTEVGRLLSGMLGDCDRTKPSGCNVMCRSEIGQVLIPHEMVEVLLGVAGVFPKVALGKLPDPPIRYFFPTIVAPIHRLSYPRIHGKSLGKIKGIEEHAISDLFSYAGEDHQLSLGISVPQLR